MANDSASAPETGLAQYDLFFYSPSDMQHKINDFPTSSWRTET